MGILDFLNTGGGKFDPFFSLKGQSQRIGNVVNVLSESLNPFSSTKPKATTGNTYVDSGLNIVAAHPYATAAAATTIATGVAGSAIAGLSTKTKLISGAVASIAVPAVLSSPKATKAVSETISNIQPLKLGNDIGKVIENPSLDTLKTIGKEDKTTLIAGAAAAALLGGGAAAALYSNYANTQAVKENTKVTQESLNSSINQSAPITVDPNKTDYSEADIKKIIDQRIKETTLPPPIPSTQATSSEVKASGGSNIKKKKKKKKAVVHKKTTKKKKKKVYKKRKTTNAKKKKKNTKKRK